MIRIVNFFCVALMGLSILALYHVSEATRVTHVQLDRVSRQIGDDKGQIGVMQAEWERVAGPARIQALAQNRLGMSDTVTAQLSSFEQLPHKSEDLNNSPLRNASAQVPAQAPIALPVQQIADRSGM